MEVLCEYVDALKIWETCQEYNHEDIQAIVQECGCGADKNITFNKGRLNIKDILLLWGM